MWSMNKRAKRITALLMAMTMGAAMLSGCASEETGGKVEIEPMEAEESYAMSFDLLGGKDVMPIGGFYGPYQPKESVDGNALPNYLTDDIFQALSEAGINMVTQAYNSGRENIRKSLDLGEKYGIGINISNWLNEEEASEKTDADIAAELAQWSRHPAFCGIHLNDEPGGKTYYTSEGANGGLMENWSERSIKLNKTLDVFAMTNLIRCYSDSQKANYELYLQEYFDTMAPKVLSYDYYAWDWVPNGTSTLYFWNLAICREYAQKYHVPLWTYQQAGGNWGDGNQVFDDTYENYRPTEGQFQWQVNTNLAFGVQGITYFTLIQPMIYSEFDSKDGQPNFEVQGILGAVGNKNRWWYYAQNMNKQIAAVDDVLMNSVNKGIIASGSAKASCADTRDALIAGTAWRELASVDGDALVGCFNYQGKTALYVVNFDYEYAQKINLTFQDKYKVRIVQGAEESYLQTKKLTLDLGAGEGALVVFE